MRSAAEKRHNDWKKAIRKRRLDRETYGPDMYDNLHQYSKNKIHCSCPLCSAKTNNKGRSGAKGWMPTKNWSISDRRKIESMETKYLTARRIFDIILSEKRKAPLTEDVV